MLPETLTNIRLLSGVPFINDYKHVRWFKSKAEQDNYFNSRNVISKKDNCSVIPTGNAFQIDLEISIEQAQKVSYLEFTNNKTGGKKYYCFVVAVNYSKLNTATLTIELDFFQTFRFDVNFKKSYIDRQHGKVNLMSDPLKLGDELVTYDIVDITFDNLIYFIVVSKKPLNDRKDYESLGTVNGSPTPLFHYIVPYDKRTLEPINIRMKQSGIGEYRKTPRLSQLMYNIKNDWANHIDSFYWTKAGGINFNMASQNNEIVYQAQDGVNTDLVKFKSTIAGEDISYIMPLVMNVTSYTKRTTIVQGLKGRLPSGYDPKVYHYPFFRFILSDPNGNQLEIKPEFLQGNNMEIDIFGSCGTMNKIGYTIKNYATKGYSSGLNNRLSFNNMMIDSEPNLLPILVDQYSAYIQGNANSMQAQREVSGNNWKTSLKNSATSGLANTLGAGINGMSMSLMNPMSAPMSIGGIISSGVDNIANQTNVNRSGKNNFENLVLQQNAMLDDLESLPPNAKTIGGNSFFSIGNFRFDLRLTIKGPSGDDCRRISSYFDHFGYAVNQYENINFTSNQYFNYVKTNDCHVTGNLNQSILDVFRNIFNGGVFLHHTDNMNV